MVTNPIQPTCWPTCRPTRRPTYHQRTTNTLADTRTTRRPTLHRCIGRRECINNFELCCWVPSLRRAQYNSFLGLLVHYGTYVGMGYLWGTGNFIKRIKKKMYISTCWLSLFSDLVAPKGTVFVVHASVHE